jgi:hypothetical protein
MLACAESALTGEIPTETDHTVLFWAAHAFVDDCLFQDGHCVDGTEMLARLMDPNWEDADGLQMHVLGWDIFEHEQPVGIVPLDQAGVASNLRTWCVRQLFNSLGSDLSQVRFHLRHVATNGTRWKYEVVVQSAGCGMLAFAELALIGGYGYPEYERGKSRDKHSWEPDWLSLERGLAFSQGLESTKQKHMCLFATAVQSGRGVWNELRSNLLSNECWAGKRIWPQRPFDYRDDLTRNYCIRPMHREIELGECYWGCGCQPTYSDHAETWMFGHKCLMRSRAGGTEPGADAFDQQPWTISKKTLKTKLEECEESLNVLIHQLGPANLIIVNEQKSAASSSSLSSSSSLPLTSPSSLLSPPPSPSTSVSSSVVSSSSSSLSPSSSSLPSFGLPLQLSSLSRPTIVPRLSAHSAQSAHSVQTAQSAQQGAMTSNHIIYSPSTVGQQGQYSQQQRELTSTVPSSAALIQQRSTVTTTSSTVSSTQPPGPRRSGRARAQVTVAVFLFHHIHSLYCCTTVLLYCCTYIHVVKDRMARRH